MTLTHHDIHIDVVRALNRSMFRRKHTYPAWQWLDDAWKGIRIVKATPKAELGYSYLTRGKKLHYVDSVHIAFPYRLKPYRPVMCIRWLCGTWTCYGVLWKAEWKLPPELNLKPCCTCKVKRSGCG